MLTSVRHIALHCVVCVCVFCKSTASTHCVLYSNIQQPAQVLAWCSNFGMRRIMPLPLSCHGSFGIPGS